MRRSQGFTLVELLIASSIFVVVMFTIYSAFNSGIFGYRNMEEVMDTYQAARQILERLNLDLRSSFIYSPEDVKFSGTNKQFSLLALVDVYEVNKVTQKYASISYALEGNKLERLCRTDQEALNKNSEIIPEEMADNAEISFSYLYLDHTDNSLKEKEVWEEKLILPLAVKIDLTIKSKIEAHFERTVYLPLGG